MRKLISAVLVVSTMLCAPAHADNTDAVRDAKEAAQLWFASADAGLYEKTWEQAAPAFQQAITKADWAAALKSVRAPIGELKNRSVISAAVADNPPGAPRGKYVVIQYASEYTKKASVIETVTPMLGEDGSWRVSGYFVK